MSVGHAPMNSALAVALLLSLVTWTSRAAHAHEVGLSRGDYAVAGAEVTATLTFASRDVASASADSIARGLILRGDDRPCPSVLASSAPFENDAVRVVVRATCPAPPRLVVVETLFLAELPFGHRHLARAPAVGGGHVEQHLTLSKRTFSFSRAAEPARPSPGFFAMGVEHILTGYDHLVFLLGLVVAGCAARDRARTAPRARELLLLVTAFTVGHSLSLALATLGVIVPSARLVEPLIALSIVYVGLDNLFSSQRSTRKRWRITLPFGMVHGFGFASALRELELPRAEVPAALLVFNLGVEVGQLAVLALLAPLVWWAERSPWYRDKGVRVLSVIIATAGLAWFAMRLAGK